MSGMMDMDSTPLCDYYITPTSSYKTSPEIGL